MPTLIFDIETTGENFDSLDKTSQGVLTRWLKKSSKSEEAYEVGLKNIKEGMGLSPWTGEIASVGVLDYEKNKGAVYFQSTDKKQEFEEDDIKYKSLSEKEMLINFWQGVKGYNNFVSFNGRSFDIPFLMIRSAINKIRPTKNLLSNRYLSYQSANAKHIDLLDQFSFYSAVYRKPSLHLCCRAFGIESPKTKGITGDDINKLFIEKKFKDIARYNALDLFATAKLYKYWQDYINI